MIDLSTYPWSEPQERAGKVFRRAKADDVFLAAWRANSAPLKAQGVWLGAFHCSGDYEIFKFEASACRNAKTIVQRESVARCVSAPSRVERRMKQQSAGSNPAALASSLSDASGNVDQSPVKKKSLIVAGDQPTARTSKAGASDILPKAQCSTGTKQSGRHSTRSGKVMESAGQHAKTAALDSHLIDREKEGVPASVHRNASSPNFQWLTASSPADEAYVTDLLKKRTQTITTNTGQFYALCRRKNVRIAGMKVGATNGQMICSIQYPQTKTSEEPLPMLSRSQRRKL